MRSIACLFALLAAPAFAQTAPTTQAEAAVLPRIIDTLCLNLVDAINGCETAVLLMSDTVPDTADLLIFSDRRAQDPQEILIVVRGIAFNGPWFGMSPSLERADNGSLRLIEEQVGMGRSPWTNVLTIAHRDGAFVVAGRNYSTYDRIEGGFFSCDINLLTGDWTSTAERPDPDESVLASVYDVTQSGQIEGVRLELAQWDLATALPSPCEAALAAWWEAIPQ